MGLYQQAFGIYAPHIDPDAAVKFCLQAVALERRFHTLADVLRENSDVSGIGGVPGWEIERRNDSDSPTAFASWPHGSKFRAFVDPEEFELGTPEGFYTRRQFLSFVSAIVAVYAASYPDRLGEVRSVVAVLQEASATG